MFLIIRRALNSEREHGGEFHHRATEHTKLRKRQEIGASNVGNPFNGLSALDNHFDGFGALEDFIVNLRHSIPNFGSSVPLW